jgi:hypothetical protein
MKPEHIGGKGLTVHVGYNRLLLGELINDSSDK